ncbi:PIG-L family deacetylase, partial [Flavobacteriaceae bacterium]|nr:PIG-L family deacetylase [Flavobacteriaceae bacterium]
GIGGTISKIKSSENFNSTIKVIILGEGLTSRSKERNTIKWEKELAIHQKNIQQAKKILGYDLLKTYNLPDNRFDTIPLLDIIKLIEIEKKEFKPDIVFTHDYIDLNIDHKRTNQAVLTAFRPFKNDTTKLMLTFETPSSTEWNFNESFIPNFFIELEEKYINKKIKAMGCYEYEKREAPHPRSPVSLRNLAISRGNKIGVEFAEAFKITRLVI